MIVYRSRFEAWLSLVERCVRDAEVASSNLVASISASWSSGQDDALSRRKPGFDSRWGHKKVRKLSWPFWLDNCIFHHLEGDISGKQAPVFRIYPLASYLARKSIFLSFLSQIYFPHKTSKQGHLGTCTQHLQQNFLPLPGAPHGVFYFAENIFPWTKKEPAESMLLQTLL